MTVADYCQALDRGEIIANSGCQRNEKVWPFAARSYLIESIILGLSGPAKSYVVKPPAGLKMSWRTDWTTCRPSLTCSANRWEP